MEKNIGFYSAIIQISRFFTVILCLTLLTSWTTPVFAATTPYGEARAAYKAKDYVRARALFKPLAKEGNRVAMYAMGIMFTKGRGGEVDDDLGELWLRRSAEKNYAPAIMLLGKREVRKPEGQKDWQKGCMWFKKAAEQGHKDGMILTAICYKTGDGAPGISKDYVESLAWFMAAENKGVADGTEGRKELEKMVNPEDIPIAQEKSKTLGKIKRPKKAATIASNTPKPKPALALPSSLPAPAQPKPVTAMPAPPLPAKPVKMPQPPVAKSVTTPIDVSSGKPPLQGQNAPKGPGNQRAVDCFDLGQGQDSCIQACQSGDFKKKFKKYTSRKEGWDQVALDTCLSGCASTKTAFIEASDEFGDYKDTKFFCPKAFQKVESAIREHKNGPDPKGSALGHLKKNAFAYGQLAFRDGAFIKGKDRYAKYAYQTIPVQLKNTPKVEAILAEFPARLDGVYGTAGVLDKCITLCDKGKWTKIPQEEGHDLCVQGCNKGVSLLRDKYAWTNRFQDKGNFVNDSSPRRNILDTDTIVQELRAEAKAQKIPYPQAQAIQYGAIRYFWEAEKAK